MNPNQPRQPSQPPRRVLQSGDWIRLNKDIGPLPWPKGSLVQIVQRVKRSSQPNYQWQENVFDTDYLVKRWSPGARREYPISSQKQCHNVVIPHKHLRKADGRKTRETFESGEKVLLAKAYSLTFKGAVYHFETGTKVMIHKRSTRMLDGRGFQTSDPTESVWDVEFGLVELKWTSEEYPLGVSHEDIVVAHRRDIPNVDEISTMVRDLW